MGDELNDNSGGLALNLPSGQTEVWMRWYMRWQPGFKANTGMKGLYLYGQDDIGFGYFLVNYYGDQGAGGFSWRCQYGGCGEVASWSVPLTDWPSTGRWYCMELHFKSETGPGTNDGLVEFWLDGTLALQGTGIDIGLNSAGRKFSWFKIASNHAAYNNGQCMYVDYDDFAISNTGRIGCTGTPPPQPYCGDLSCNGGETCSSCPGDCGSCAQCIHKSDTDCNGCVDTTELTAFISRWQVNNQDVTLKELMEAIGLWKRGCA
jgi:hypothetical protein